MWLNSLSLRVNYRCKIRNSWGFNTCRITLNIFQNFTDNHHQLFSYSGFKDIRYYRYWDPATRGVDFGGMLEDIEEAPEDSVIVLHMAAHNPTGCDLTRQQWQQIADVMEVSLLHPCHSVARQTRAAHQKRNTELNVRHKVPIFSEDVFV